VQPRRGLGKPPDQKRVSNKKTGGGQKPHSKGHQGEKGASVSAVLFALLGRNGQARKM
jgi:hypothetical protein